MKHKLLTGIVLAASLALSGCTIFNPTPTPAPEEPLFHFVDSVVKLQPGETYNIDFEYKNIEFNEDKITWATDNQEIASIDTTHLVVTAVDFGTTFIHAYAKDKNTNVDFHDSLKIVIKNPDQLWDETQDSLRNGAKTLDFYSLNDFHGSTEYNSEQSEPGINYLSSFMKQEMAKNEAGSVFTSSGDMWQGSCDSNLTHGALVNDWMELLNCSAMTVGNHEFDWTIETIKENINHMAFPLISCNIMEIGTETPVDWVEPYTTITKNGVHIGIVGAIGKNLKGDILTKNVKDVEFKDPNPYIVKYADFLREKGADVVLVLLHDSTNAISASTYSHIDGLFGGHAHSRENENYNGVPAIQASCNGKCVGHINMTYDFTNKKVSSSTGEILSSYANVCDKLGEDAETKALYDEYLMSDMLAPKDYVCSTYTGGISRNDIPYVYCDYAAKYYHEFHESDGYEFLCINTNGARAAINSGKQITYADVYKALPFDNILTVMSVLGKDLSYVMNYGVLYAEGQGRTNLSALMEKATDPNKKYYVLTIDYVATYENKSSYVTIEKTYEEDEALPRNILRRYLKDYPTNCNI